MLSNVVFGELPEMPEVEEFTYEEVLLDDDRFLLEKETYSE